MGYSESAFGVAADIVWSAENSSTANPQEVFEDLVIALSLDTGLPRKEARIRLEAMMPIDYNALRRRPALDEPGCSVVDFKPRRSR